MRGVHLICLVLSVSLASAEMLGGFKRVDNHANDAGVASAAAAAEQGLASKLGAAPGSVEVLSAETQVVAGTNYKLKLKVDAAGATKYYEAKVWEKLPAYGGAFELTHLEEISAAQAGVGSGPSEADEFEANPEVDDAAAYAVQQLSSQSNSLFPFTLKKVLSSRVRKDEHGVTHRMRLQLSHGSMPDSVYEVEVANPGGSYQLKSSQQAALD